VVDTEAQATSSEPPGISTPDGLTAPFLSSRKKEQTEHDPPLPDLDILVPQNTSAIGNSKDVPSTSKKAVSNAPDDQQPLQLVDPRLGDYERSRSRYTEAVKQLKESLELGRAQWEGFASPDVDGVSETIVQMRRDLESMLNTWKVSRENPNLWSKGKHMVTQIFTATSPFFKNFLTVALNSQSV
jgi:hypothetical protein